jgi:hypothetical protein
MKCVCSHRVYYMHSQSVTHMHIETTVHTQRQTDRDEEGVLFFFSKNLELVGL